MGAYINPPNESKEAFLAREGLPISPLVAQMHEDFEDIFLVAHVINFNGGFTAAAIAYEESERDEFTRATEKRPVKYFLVRKEKLLPVSNLSFYLEKKRE